MDFGPIQQHFAKALAGGVRLSKRPDCGSGSRPIAIEAHGSAAKLPFLVGTRYNGAMLQQSYRAQSCKNDARPT